jgi:RimJ/RimL family protein N-acetyltransferase
MHDVRLQALMQEAAETITQWPPYPEDLRELDYALRPGGWLDQFPESSTCHRYAATEASHLVGFTILTGIHNEDAEFYIALHQDYLGRGIGTAITRQTVSIGFHSLELSRIHLKVRLWRCPPVLSSSYG